MINPNYTSTPFPGEPSVGDQHHQFFVPNYQSSASSSSFSCHRVFFNTPQDDQTEYYHTTLVQHQEGENRAGSYDVEKKDNQSLKLTLWKNEKQKTDEENPAKWMPPKMRLVQKMKNSAVNNSNSNSSMVNLEDQQISSFESDQYLCSNVSSSYNSNPTVRVCADCNTTKTPLWRSGPKGPKSLCNACGIRQRKARRAMAAAAAAANGTSLASETATLKIKVQNNKEKIKHNNIHGHHAPQFKKRCKLTVAESSSSSSQHGPKKNVFEDFLFNLSKNLAFHRVFPQDEKEAAILLMALSCGLVHG